MNQPFIRCGIFCAIGVCLTVTAWAANKPKVSSESADAVQELLQSEPQSANESLDRRDVLKPGARPDNDSNSAWWQSGYTKSGNLWVRYEESIARGSDQKLLEEYQDQRLKLSNQPHGEWQLANWCRKNGLMDQERVHLLNVLAIQDSAANQDIVRERLGFRKIGNQWVSPKEQQDVAEQNLEIEQSHKRWDAKFQTLISQLDGTPKQRIAAEKQLAEISHPSVVPTIVSTLCVSSQPLAEQGVKVLGQIPEFEASRALAGQAVFSPWKPARKQAIEYLKKRKLEEYIPDLLLLLSNPIQLKFRQDVRVTPRFVNEGVWIFAQPDVRVNIDYAWVEETRDTIRVGIRRLFPASAPSAFFSFDSSNQGPLANGQRNSVIATAAAENELRFQADLLDFNAEQMNDFRTELNERVGRVLSDCTNLAKLSEPNAWWDWWANYSVGGSVGPKAVVVVDERPRIPPHSCLVASTPVWTERGFAAIESIRAGDRVLSKDVITGELSYKPVMTTTERKPTAIWKFCVGSEAIEASLGHHFWVSGDGWDKTKALIPGAPLHTVTGMQRISRVEDEGKSEKVYNLVVADFHTYFVGKSMILSHDVTTPSLTNVKIPGLLTK